MAENTRIWIEQERRLICCDYLSFINVISMDNNNFNAIIHQYIIFQINTAMV